jgi:hypothetical protein
MKKKISFGETMSIDRLSPSIQFVVLSCGVFFFFGMHNLLQEAMMTIPGFKFGVMLGAFMTAICQFPCLFPGIF